MGVRRGDNHRLPGQVEPRAGIQGVEVRPHDALEIGGRVSRDVVEHVHRTLAEFLAGSMLMACLRVTSIVMSG